MRGSARASKPGGTGGPACPRWRDPDLDRLAAGPTEPLEGAAEMTAVPQGDPERRITLWEGTLQLDAGETRLWELRPGGLRPGRYQVILRAAREEASQ